MDFWKKVLFGLTSNYILFGLNHTYSLLVWQYGWILWLMWHLINNHHKTILLDVCNAMRLFLNWCAQCNQIIYQCFRLHLCLLYLKPPRESYMLICFLNTLLFSKGSWFRTVSFPDTSPCYLFDKSSISKLCKWDDQKKMKPFWWI